MISKMSFKYNNLSKKIFFINYNKAIITIFKSFYKNIVNFKLIIHYKALEFSNNLIVFT